MSLLNATVLSGTTLGTTGGTTVNFAPSGKDVPEGVEIIDVGATDFRTRCSITCRSRMPVYNASTNTYSKGKRWVHIVMPKILASGVTTFPVVRIEVDDHPEQSAAEKLELLKYAAQVLFDADFAQFFASGSRA